MILTFNIVVEIQTTQNIIQHTVKTYLIHTENFIEPIEFFPN